MFPISVYQGLSGLCPVALHPTPRGWSGYTCSRLWPVRSFSTPSMVQRHLTAYFFNVQSTPNAPPPWIPAATHSRGMLSQPDKMWCAITPNAYDGNDFFVGDRTGAGGDQSVHPAEHTAQTRRVVLPFATP